MSGEVVTKRLHVGGITPNITSQHLKDRFASFGKVQNVDDLAPDALGQRRPFTFLTIDITPMQLKKCLNIMSGSMWRGTQLRVAEAKMSYQDRLEKERNPPKEVEELIIRKRQRRSGTVNAAAGIGKEAQDMRPVTPENYSKKKFWTLDMEGHLIRPIAMRPSHPLLPLPDRDIAAGPSRRPAPSRARRRVIDPAKWRPMHLAADALDPQEGVSGSPEGEWEWHEADSEDGADEGNDYIVGWWRRTENGQMLEQQEVRSKRRRLSKPLEEGLGSEDEVGSADSGSDLFGRRGAGDRESSPLFGERSGVPVEEDDPQSRSSSPFFTPRSELKFSTELIVEGAVVNEDEEEVEHEQEEQDEQRADAAASDDPHIDEDNFSTVVAASEKGGHGQSSPLFPAKIVGMAEEAKASTSATRSLSSLSVSRPPSMAQPVKIVTYAAPKNSNTIVPDPLRHQVLAERSRDLSLLDSILGGANAYGGDLEVSKPSFSGFRESDDEDEDGEGGNVLRLRGGASPGVLRLRGGAPDDEDMSETSETSTSSVSSSSAPSDDSSESETEPDSKPNGAPTGTAALNVTTNAGPSRPLKDMFAPSAPNSGGFSLLASLDPDLELDELDVPLAASVRPVDAEKLQPLEPLQPTGIAGTFDPDPSIPLFFPTHTSFGQTTEGIKGTDGFAQDARSDGWRPFWRCEGETDENMKEQWERDRLKLTRDWKKRHREAKKHRKRRGGVDEVE